MDIILILDKIVQIDANLYLQIFAMNFLIYFDFNISNETNIVLLFAANPQPALLILVSDITLLQSDRQNDQTTQSRTDSNQQHPEQFLQISKGYAIYVSFKRGFQQMLFTLK